MFGLLNQGHISLNTISIILAMIVMILLFKMEKKTENPFYQLQNLINQSFLHLLLIYLSLCH